MTDMEFPDAEIANPGQTESDLVASLTDHVTLTDSTRDTFEVEAPFTGELLGEVPACTPDDLEAAVTRAERAQERLVETDDFRRNYGVLGRPRPRIHRRVN